MTIVVQARLAKITDVWTRAPALVEAGLSAKWITMLLSADAHEDSPEIHSR